MNFQEFLGISYKWLELICIHLYNNVYSSCNAACAAASRAIGTWYGEQLT